jgi:hypothetical protein
VKIGGLYFCRRKAGILFFDKAEKKPPRAMQGARTTAAASMLAETPPPSRVRFSSKIANLACKGRGFEDLAVPSRDPIGLEGSASRVTDPCQ